jgi:polyisoprenoid-binding protein YceI
MIANVKGQFSNVSGALFLDEANLANSGVDVSIGTLLWRRAFPSASLIK